jgi:hypothetical protein
MLKRVDAVLLYQPSQQTARDIEIEINAFMAPRLRAIGAPPTPAISVLPKPCRSMKVSFSPSPVIRTMASSTASTPR